eukprot:TRINITY_DN9482_c0_g1_i1.p2 TRINITY_DN9482_c0_g1~~TRINITY_DN9482_c0_g1_i1.p2  ORF type:complete len:101 (+),score=7.11 TRINITY_DN9482_c0_g1_i1:61-363(+)
MARNCVCGDKLSPPRVIAHCVERCVCTLNGVVCVVLAALALFVVLSFRFVLRCQNLPHVVIAAQATMAASTQPIVPSTPPHTPRTQKIPQPPTGTRWRGH